jgi:SSS family solute:Na+ symporter
MYLQTLDIALILTYFLISLGIGIYYARRAGKNTSEFFLSGRNLPWWLAGTAMVATTFAADTPLAVTELVAKHGIAGNWLWWNFAFGGMLTVFFFARLWRRAGILTDIELTEIRYSGRPAAFLRGYRALFIGVAMNVAVMSWVNLAMEKIIRVLFPDATFLGLESVNIAGIILNSSLLWVGAAMLLVAVYSALSGLWGVAVTDAFQFVLAMVGTTVLAIIVLDLPEIGGVSGLMQQLPSWAFQFTPTVGVADVGIGGVFALTVSAFIGYVGVLWWSSWYPGAEPGGGGYIAQRMMSAKDEKHSLFATLWFTVAHYCLRPWPWIIVGLASLVLYPHLGFDEKGEGYVMVMRDYLPSGLLGLLVAAFFAAYMSTIATHLNWGTSYVINDFYRRFIRRDADESHYVLVSRIATVLFMVLSLLVTSQIQRISAVWEFILAISGGVGLVLILRWYWWRINAWSELTAMFAPLVPYTVITAIRTSLSPDDPWVMYLDFPYSLFGIVGFTTIAWLTVTMLTKPTDEEVLMSFFRRVRPGGKGWQRIASKMPEVNADTNIQGMIINWIAGVVLVYMALFGTGKLIFGDMVLALVFYAIGLGAAWVIYRDLSKRGWGTISS